MADYKVWKLSEFTGGLNSFTDSRDLEPNEFAEFVDIYSAQGGIIKPIGQAINNFLVTPKNIEGRLLDGGGFATYNSDYTFQSDLTEDLSYAATQLSQAGTGTAPSRATFMISSLVWIFEKTFPVGGTLTFTPKIRKPSDGSLVTIGDTITVATGNQWLQPTWTEIADSSPTSILNTEDPFYETGFYQVLTGDDGETTTNIFQGKMPFAGNAWSGADFGELQFYHHDPSEEYAGMFGRCWTIADNTPASIWTMGNNEWDLWEEAEFQSTGDTDDQNIIGPMNTDFIRLYNGHWIFQYWYFHESHDITFDKAWGIGASDGRFNGNMWTDEAHVLGGKTGCSDDEWIPFIGKHGTEYYGVTQLGKSAGWLHARWGYGYMDLENYFLKIYDSADSGNPSQRDAFWGCVSLNEQWSMPGVSQYLDAGLGDTHWGGSAACRHMQAVMMLEIAKSINNYAGSGTEDKWTATLLEPDDPNNIEDGFIEIAQPFITIKSDDTIDAKAVNDFEITGTLAAASLKPDSGDSYPVSGTTPEFIAHADGDSASSWLDSRVTISEDISNATDRTIHIEAAPSGGTLENAWRNEYSYTMNLFRPGIFIKIDNEIMRVKRCTSSDMFSNTIVVDRGSAAGFGSKTGSTADTHTSGTTIHIAKHGLMWEGMGNVNLDYDESNGYINEYLVPLTPMVLKGDTKTFGGAVNGGRFLTKIDLRGEGAGDILTIRFGAQSQTFSFSNQGDLSNLALQIESSFGALDNYAAKGLGELADSDGYTIIFYNTPNTKVNTTLTEAVTNSTDTTLIVDSVTGLAAGDVMHLATELVYIESINVGAKTLTVERAVGGTDSNAPYPIGTKLGLLNALADVDSYDTTFEVNIDYAINSEVQWRGDDEHLALLTETNVDAGSIIMPGTNMYLDVYKTDIGVFSVGAGSWMTGFKEDEISANRLESAKFDWVYARPLGKVKSFLYTILNSTAGSTTEDLISGNWGSSAIDFNVTQTSTTGIGAGCTVNLIPQDFNLDGTYEGINVVIAANGNNYRAGDIIVYTDPGGSTTINLEVKEIEPKTLQYNNPIFWNEGNRLRISDGNFNLPNETKWIGFKYNETMFQSPNLPAGTSGYEPVEFEGFSNQDICPMTGILVGNNDKIWKYSVPYDGNSNTTGEAASSLKGLNVRGNVALENHISLLSELLFRMVCHFEKIDADADMVSDWTGDVRFYAAAVYDDGSQGLPTHCFEENNSGNNTWSFTGTTEGSEVGQYRLKLHIGHSINPMVTGGPVFPDPRIIGIHLYMASSEEAFEQLWSIGEVNFFTGFSKTGSIESGDSASYNDNAGNNIATSGQAESYVWNKSKVHSGGTANNQNSAFIWNSSSDEDFVMFDTMPKVKTFEVLNGYSFGESTLSVRYKTATIGGRRTFAGNIAVNDSFGNTELHNDRMVVSPVNQLDTFPYPGNVLDLDISDGDKIVSLKSLSDKILQFKERIMYVINISTGIAKDFFVEERFKYRGVKSNNHVCETSNAIFWFNDNGAFLYDGEKITELFIKGGEKDEDNKERIDLEVWRDFISIDSMCGFNPTSRELFVVKKSYHTQASDGDAYIYNEITDTWVYVKEKFFNGIGRRLTNLINVGSEDKISYLYEASHSDVPDNDGSELL